MQNDGMSPYQAPVQASPALPTQEKVSSIPKVMGILHIIFGSISLLLAVSGLMQPGAQSDQLREQMQVQTGQEVEISEGAMKAIESMDSLGVIAGVINLVGAIALLVAGIGLVRYLRWGRRFSNVYVLLSFVGKVFAGYMMLGPMSRFMSELIASQPDLEGQSPDGLRSIIIGSMIVMLLIMSVYMVVSLILVNKKSARESLK